LKREDTTVAQLIKADGTTAEVRPADGESFTLVEMQEFVGGYIEIFAVGEGEMVVNEEGKLLGLPFNREATRLAGPYLFAHDPGVFGDVLVCTPYEAGYRDWREAA
jgi:hypothetical protein